MAQYIDGFAFPIKRSSLEAYKKLSQGAAGIWTGHGALDYCEFVSDDLSLAGVLPFDQAVKAGQEDVVIFGWVAYSDKSSRDRINQKVAEDPAMTALIERYDTGFDPSTMAFGGFQKL